ncbi:MAG: phage tail protein, partial [Dehalococcoidales bacterium]|nr:phage tail protein [Dehalococcoidales bacterium]
MATIQELGSVQPAVTTAAGEDANGLFIQYLPSIYREHELVREFLGIFDAVWLPIDGLVASLSALLDPRETPEHMLPWLASWVAVVADDRWPLERRRTLVREAAELFRRRGTRAGLKRYLEICTGVEPLIVENCDGIRLGGDCRLGYNTRLGRRRDFWLDTTLPLEAPGSLDEVDLRAILEAEKPAHCTYRLTLVRRGPAATSGDQEADAAA